MVVLTPKFTSSDSDTSLEFHQNTLVAFTQVHRWNSKYFLYGTALRMVSTVTQMLINEYKWQEIEHHKHHWFESHFVALRPILSAV